MSDCVCPLPTELGTIPALDCGVNLKQIQRLAFQRFGPPDSQFGPGATTPNDITVLADWQAFLAAADNTKIVVTPLIGADPIIEAGTAITTGGGDNTTLNGVEEVEGTNPSAFSATFKEITPEIELALKQLTCEKNLTVYMILEGGRIAAYSIDADNQRGFLLQSMFVSDRNNAGFATKDTNTISFSFPAGWSENLVIIDPAFNPLTDL
jgi:hypothetical protein